MAVLPRVVLRPLDRLIRATRRLAAGDNSERVDVRAVSKPERVAGAFNSIAAAIEADLAARKCAEGEAVAARSVAEHASRAHHCPGRASGFRNSWNYPDRCIETSVWTSAFACGLLRS
jgi:HAMP domain-containing protein